jgi:hypothetical protein
MRKSVLVISVLLGALTASGCYSTEPGRPAVGDVDDEGCTLTERIRRDPQIEEQFPDDDSPFYNRGRLPVVPKVGPNQKLVKTDSYYEIYDCPKITLPEELSPW